MSQLKRLSISLEQEYIHPQVALEGLWDTIKGLFSDTTPPKDHKSHDSKIDQFPYHLLDKTVEFFTQLENRSIELKTENIKSNYNIAVFMKDYEFIPNLIPSIKKQLKELDSYFNKTVTADKSFAEIVEKAFQEANKVKDTKDFDQILNKYKSQLIKSPAELLKNLSLFGMSGSELITVNEKFSPQICFNSEAHYLYKFHNNDHSIPPCTEEDLKDIKQIIKDLTLLLKKFKSISPNITNYSESNLSLIFKSTHTPSAIMLRRMTVDLSYGVFPYAQQIIWTYAFDILRGLCNWTRHSIKDLNDL